MKQGCVFNIQRYTVHDGPGIRTEVFLKGCPLACPWCSNPESRHVQLEPGVYPARCLGREQCGLCAQTVAGPDVVKFDDGGRIRSIRRDVEADWIACVRACPADALKIWGMRMDVDEVMEVVEKDRCYYETSGGGVTVSGGEPLVQAEFATAMLKACQQAGIHTCLETTLHAPWAALESALVWTDLLICDLKCADAEKHARATGVRNDTVLENLARASRATDQIIVRIPVIPGFNDDMDDLDAAASLLEEKMDVRPIEVQLLEFMHLGEEKCRSLERPYPLAGCEVNRDELHGRVLAMQKRLASRSFNCTLGGGLKKS